MSVQQKRFQTGELIFKSIESESYNALLVATEHKNARHLKNVDADLGADCRTYANRSARKDTGFIKYVRRLKTNVRSQNLVASHLFCHEFPLKGHCGVIFRILASF